MNLNRVLATLHNIHGIQNGITWIISAFQYKKKGLELNYMDFNIILVPL